MQLHFTNVCSYTCKITTHTQEKKEKKKVELAIKYQRPLLLNITLKLHNTNNKTLTGWHLVINLQHFDAN